MDNRATRRWDLAQDAKIPSLVDENLSMLEQAVMAYLLRNQNRTWARDLMFDQEVRRGLDMSDPNLSFEERVLDKMKRKGITREAAIKDILTTATKTRQSVNEELGLK